MHHDDVLIFIICCNNILLYYFQKFVYEKQLSNIVSYGIEESESKDMDICHLKSCTSCESKGDFV